TFAQDLDQPVNFDLMVDSDDMLSHAVEQLMDKVGQEGNEQLTALVVDYASNMMQDGSPFDIERRLGELGTELLTERGEQNVRRLTQLSLPDFRQLARRYAAYCRRYESEVRSVAKQMVQWAAEHGVEVSMTVQKSRGWLAFVSELAVGRIKKPSATLMKALQTHDMLDKKLPPDTQANLNPTLPDLFALADKLLALMDEQYVNYQTAKLVLKNMHVEALLGALDHELQQYLRETGTLHISSFNKLINRVVENEPAPFLFERLGNRYRHVLIDEFQDTSVLQWHNMVPLMENGVAEGHGSMVVGDGKQAIYRFRQGDVQQFIDLPHVRNMASQHGTLAVAGNFEHTRLVGNFRTARQVVEFNNGFFSWLVRHRYADNDLASAVYLGHDPSGQLLPVGSEELRQTPCSPQEGCVTIDYAPKGDVDALCGAVLARAEELVGKRGFAPHEVMILTHRNRDLALVADYMAANSTIPTTSAETLLLRNSDAVMAVVEALRVLANPADRVSAVAVCFHLDRLGLIGEGVAERIAADASINIDGWLAACVPPIDFNIRYLSSLDLYDCCEHIIRRLRLGGVDTPYLAAFLNKVATFASHRDCSIQAFLEWFDSKKELSASTSDNLDAVKLMTIHKAKGLEAPAVIALFRNHTARAKALWVDVPPIDDEAVQLPVANLTLAKESSTLFDADRQHEEEMQAVDALNMAYVALTRPRERLCVVLEEGSEKGKNEVMADLMKAFVEECKPEMGNVEASRTAVAQAPKSDITEVEQLSYADWTTKVRVASPTEQRLDDVRAEAIRFGQHAHDLLSGIKNIDNVSSALEEFFALHNIADGEQQRLNDLVARVTTDKLCQDFFAADAEVLNECEFVADGHLLRPDRVVIKEGKCLVVDYKTGAEMADHALQVRQYCEAMKRMGYDEVSGWIVYLMPDVKVVQCA
ncbi:MAG: UvrD-helicase domain-containing protein, partial [Bacteroidales bacterium]|nr:UvrD-helicase domain-containing protein [Bacteroidales bacterium]